MNPMLTSPSPLATAASVLHMWNAIPGDEETIFLSVHVAFILAFLRYDSVLYIYKHAVLIGEFEITEAYEGMRECDGLPINAHTMDSRLVSELRSFN